MNVITSPTADEAASAPNRASRTGRIFNAAKVVVQLLRQRPSISIDGSGITANIFCASDPADEPPILARLMQRHRLIAVASRS